MLEWYNDLADKVIGAEVKLVLQPLGDALSDGLSHVIDALTVSMPDIGAGIVVLCGVGMMITGNVPKWIGRCAVGLGGAIIWLLSVS